MTSQSRSVERAARRAIVFGGGGVLGGTWAVGALSAWEQTTGLRAKDVDILVGTSAGSVLASLVACGVSTDELIAHYQDEQVSTGPLAGYQWDPDRATGGHKPGVPRLRGPGSPALIRSVFEPGPTSRNHRSLGVPTGGWPFP